MNLIEELGGYEKVKSERDKINHRLNNGDFLGGGSPKEYLYERLDLVEIELLEHRRANNIFEKGDVVKAKDHQFGFDELYKIEDFFADGDGVNLAVLDDGDCYPISFLEHVTNEEIKAGHRL